MLWMVGVACSLHFLPNPTAIIISLMQKPRSLPELQIVTKKMSKNIILGKLNFTCNFYSFFKHNLLVKVNYLDSFTFQLN